MQRCEICLPVLWLFRHLGLYCYKNNLCKKKKVEFIHFCFLILNYSFLSEKCLWKQSAFSIRFQYYVPIMTKCIFLILFINLFTDSTKFYLPQSWIQAPTLSTGYPPRKMNILRSSEGEKKRPRGKLYMSVSRFIFHQHAQAAAWTERKVPLPTIPSVTAVGVSAAKAVAFEKAKFYLQ